MATMITLFVWFLSYGNPAWEVSAEGWPFLEEFILQRKQITKRCFQINYNSNAESPSYEKDLILVVSCMVLQKQSASVLLLVSTWTHKLWSLGERWCCSFDVKCYPRAPMFEGGDISEGNDSLRVGEGGSGLQLYSLALFSVLALISGPLR